MKAVTLLSAAVLAVALTASAQAQCYRKVGAACKPGFASGYGADCSTPCAKPVKGAKQMQPAPAAQTDRKPHQIISPTD